VDGDDVNAFAFERVQVNGQGSDEGFTFAGFHFGDLALMQDDSADQLLVEVPHVENAVAGLAHDGEGFDQDIVQCGALGEPCFEVDGFGGQLGVGKLLDFLLQRVHGCNPGPEGLNIALVLRAENLGQNCIYHRISVSAEAAMFILPQRGGAEPLQAGKSSLLAQLEDSSGVAGGGAG